MKRRPSLVVITIPSKTSTSGTSSTCSRVPICLPVLLSTGVPRVAAWYEMAASSVMLAPRLAARRTGRAGPPDPRSVSAGRWALAAMAGHLSAAGRLPPAGSREPPDLLDLPGEGLPHQPGVLVLLMRAAENADGERKKCRPGASPACSAMLRGPRHDG